LDYLSSISGIRSWAMVSDEDELASQGKDATTSISESVHALSTVGLGIVGTICLITLLQRDRHIPTIILVVVMSDW
jgi:hypothetical protein